MKDKLKERMRENDLCDFVVKADRNGEVKEIYVAKLLTDEEVKELEYDNLQIIKKLNK